MGESGHPWRRIGRQEFKQTLLAKIDFVFNKFSKGDDVYKNRDCTDTDGYLQPLSLQTSRVAFLNSYFIQIDCN